MLTLILNFFRARAAAMMITMAAIFTMYSNVTGIIQTAKSLLTTAHGVHHASMSSVSTFALGVLGLVNYVVPIDLALAMVVIWLPIFLVCATVRLVKSFVPTVS